LNGEENEEEYDEILNDLQMKNALKTDEKLFYECCFDRYIVEYGEPTKKGLRRVHEFYYARGNKKHRQIKKYHLELKPNVEDVHVKYIKKR
jgi:hypothetical protein